MVIELKMIQWALCCETIFVPLWPPPLRDADTLAKYRYAKGMVTYEIKKRFCKSFAKRLASYFRRNHVTEQK